jgi:hypothetical protein
MLLGFLGQREEGWLKILLRDLGSQGKNYPEFESPEVIETNIYQIGSRAHSKLRDLPHCCIYGLHVVEFCATGFSMNIDTM